MPVVPVNVVRYKAKCDDCQKERSFEAESDLSAALCAESVDGWSWSVDVANKTILCKCRACQSKKRTP